MDNKHSVSNLSDQLRQLGIQNGDAVLMHSSFKSLGGVENGPSGFFKAMLDVLGPNGTLVLPTLTYEPVCDTKQFDIINTPSCVGYLTNYFRTQTDHVRRSMHPTHSCAAVGAARDYLIEGHHRDVTPVGPNSPFAKLPLIGGKILMLGTGLAPMTSMHGVEETVRPDFLLTEKQIEYTVTDAFGRHHKMYVHRHAFKMNGYRQRYDRLADVLPEACYTHQKVFDADCFLIDAAALWKTGHKTMMDNPYFFVEKAEQNL